jgi:hypothetical protein
MMFLSQSEGWSTTNYRLMSQARDGAEAGVHRAAHFLSGGDFGLGGVQPATPPWQYRPPDPPFTSINFSPAVAPATSSPVLDSAGHRVGLKTSNVASMIPYGASNLVYPTGVGVQASVQSNFNTYVQGSLPTTNGNVTYGAYAELLSIKAIGTASLLCGGGAGSNTLERWKVTGVGQVAGVQGATVQVSSLIDRPIVSCAPVAAYATSNTCDNSNPPLSFNGGGITDSYDSTTSGCTSGNIGTTPGAGGCGLANTGGSVGTNGNAAISNSTVIGGSIYEPRPGAVGGGSCQTPVTGCTSPTCITGTPQVIQEAQVPSYPPPTLPTPTPTVCAGSGCDTIQAPSDCDSRTLQCSRRVAATGLNLPAWTSPGGVITAGNTGGNSDKQFRMVPTCTPAVISCASGTTAYQDLAIKGNNIFHFCPGTYSVNSVAMGSGATLVIHPTADAWCSGSGPVMINVYGAGHNLNQPVIDLSSGTLTNTSMSASNFQLLYSGDDDTSSAVHCFAIGTTSPACGSISLAGGAASAALVYAPYADISISGGGTFYGAMVGYTVKTTGGGSIAYDRSLSTTAITPGNPMFQAFTWRKF